MTNTGFTPFTKPEVVQAYLQPVLQRLAIAFSEACDRTTVGFIERKWSQDAALAAYLIRKEVLECLKAEGKQIEEEDVELERKALCGLLLKLPLVSLKIRKSKDGEIPAAGSQQSLSFYNWNLLVFPQDQGDEILPLHLLLLWNDNQKGELETLLLVCVEGSTWRWRIPVFQRSAHGKGDFNVELLEEDLSPAPSRADFMTAFDSGNEDLPLKLTTQEEPPIISDDEVKADETDQGIDSKKKAQ